MPRPGMAGGLSENMTGSCIEAPISSARAMMAEMLSSARLRSAHLSRITKSEPMLELAPPPINEYPLTPITSFTPGTLSIRRVKSLTTRSVRSSEASVGSCIDVMKYPMSSSGT